ncbi:MAG: SPOR domain-containing protein [Alistipes sp.]|nr:SPOR domain-containing protein [Alistipes sp.]MBQ6581070.1 SPOR domain-containing protein [Alistipes sp.]
MIEEVNKIIYNMLISGRGVYLPGVGTLFIERQGARRIDKNRLMSPRNVVVFSSQEQAPSLVDEIVAIAGCQRAQAEDIFERWIAKTREGADVTIGGVGVLRGKSFIADKSFNSTINPKGVRTLVVRRSRSHAWIYIVCGVAVVIALAFFAYLQWGDSWGVNVDAKPEVVAVIPAEQKPEDQASADIKAEEAEPDAELANAAVATPEPQAVSKPSAYAYYVVMGVFSSEQNAQRAVEQLRSKIKDAAAEVRPFGDKYMVTAFGSDKREECNVFVRSYHDIYPDLWVYNKK